MIRIDLLRSAQRELKAAFESGELVQPLREYVAAHARAKQEASWASALLEPGQTRDLFCENLSRTWAGLPTEERRGGIVDYLHEGLKVPDEWSHAPVIPLRPKQPERSWLAELLDGLLKR